MPTLSDRRSASSMARTRRRRPWPALTMRAERLERGGGGEHVAEGHHAVERQLHAVGDRLCEIAFALSKSVALAAVARLNAEISWPTW